MYLCIYLIWLYLEKRCMTGGCLVAGSIIVAIEKRLGDNPQACRRLDSIIDHWTRKEKMEC